MKEQIERFRCTTPHHLPCDKHLPGPISHAKKCPKKCRSRHFKSENSSFSTQIIFLNFLMCLQKYLVFKFILPKCEQKGLISHEIATEMEHVAMWVPE